jgi:hypothetical protein
MDPTPRNTSIQFAAAGVLIPLLLWGIIKSRDYGLVGGNMGDSMDRWAFQFLLMLAPFFYHTVSILQDQSLTAAYATAFLTNAALYACIGALSTRLAPFHWAYYLLLSLIVASMLVVTDSWFLYRWINRDAFRLPLTLNDLDWRYFFVTAGLVITFFVFKARKRT